MLKTDSSRIVEIVEVIAMQDDLFDKAAPFGRVLMLSEVLDKLKLRIFPGCEIGTLPAWKPMESEVFWERTDYSLGCKLQRRWYSCGILPSVCLIQFTCTPEWLTCLEDIIMKASVNWRVGSVGSSPCNYFNVAQTCNIKHHHWCIEGKQNISHSSISMRSDEYDTLTVWNLL